MSVFRRLTARPLHERYLERGLWHLDKKKYEDALADLNEAIAEEPVEPELYTTRGFIYIESNNESYLPAAKEDFEYALYLDPKQWTASYFLGMITFAEDDFSEALEHFNKARDFAHLQPEIYYYRALCYHKLDDNDRAITEIEIAYDLFDNQKDSRKNSAKRWKAEFTKIKKTNEEEITPRAQQLPYTKTRPGRESVTQSGALGYGNRGAIPPSQGQD